FVNRKLDLALLSAFLTILLALSPDGDSCFQFRDPNGVVFAAGGESLLLIELALEDFEAERLQAAGHPFHDSPIDADRAALHLLSREQLPCDLDEERLGKMLTMAHKEAADRAVVGLMTGTQPPCTNVDECQLFELPKAGLALQRAIDDEADHHVRVMRV